MNPELKFLVVDDTPQMCKIILSLLSELGWTKVTVVTSGKQAIKLLQKKPFDILLLDTNMPEMDGVEMLAEMQQLPLVSEPKVIMITADCSAAVVQAAIAAGASDFVCKPFSAQTLSAKVQRLLPEVVA
jgi:two-component system, chemotaxis family, chemotaxis protein CheY